VGTSAKQSTASNASAVMIGRTARVLASQAEAIVRTGKTWPQATKQIGD